MAKTAPINDKASVLKKGWYKIPYIQVLGAIALGIIVGHFFPNIAISLKPLGDAFIKLVKMTIAPIIFITVTLGIAEIENFSRFRKIGIKALLYFMTFSSLALVIGLVAGNLIQPGKGFNVDPATLNIESVKHYLDKAKDQSLVDFLLNIIPDSIIGAFSSGQILQILFFAVFFGIALAAVGDKGKPVVSFLQSLSKAVFTLVAILMRAAPIGAFGAIAFTIGQYGVNSLTHLTGLIATFYLTAVIFIFVVLGSVAWLNGFSLLGLIRYLKEEILLVLSTSSSESALPSLIEKMEKAGCSKPVTRLVVPIGYSFNLDGTNIYMTLAALFIAQATNTPLTIGDQMLLLLVAMLSSKGSAGVAGGGLITLAATLAIIPSLPVVGIALILGVDRFMSECRALANFIGNAVATIIIARWEGELNQEELNEKLTRHKQI